MSKRKRSTEPWYSDGLAFSCTKCGACCTGAPGYVWVSTDEIDRLASFRGETTEQFSARFVRQVGDRFSLIERQGGDCIFWDKQDGCTVYPARPDQCQTWPFWPENVETQDDWNHVREICPGSGHGRLYTVDEIVSSISKTPK
jgi:Fe-S-cluster containining protein